MRGLGGLSPVKAAQVLADLVEQLRSVDPGLLARYEVHPAAVGLRDALVEALEGVEPLSLYETHRFDARQLGLRLEWVVGALRMKVEWGHDVDLEALRAYEDELVDQQVRDVVTRRSR